MSDSRRRSREHRGARSPISRAKGPPATTDRPRSPPSVATSKRRRLLASVVLSSAPRRPCRRRTAGRRQHILAIVSRRQDRRSPAPGWLRSGACRARGQRRGVAAGGWVEVARHAGCLHQARSGRPRAGSSAPVQGVRERCAHRALSLLYREGGAGGCHDNCPGLYW